MRKETALHHIHALQARLLRERVIPVEFVNAVKAALPVCEAKNLSRESPQRIVRNRRGWRSGRCGWSGRNGDAASRPQQDERDQNGGSHVSPRTSLGFSVSAARCDI